MQKEILKAPSPGPSNMGQLTHPPLHPLHREPAQLLLPSIRVNAFGISYWFPSWLLLQPGTGPSSTQAQDVFAPQEEAVQQSKAPEAEPGHLCHLWW